jgi:drug/metabolite transporter (DMT)-like permease
VLGALFALLSAIAFSLNAILVRRGVVNATPSQAAFVTVLVGVPMFLFAALATGQLLRIDELPAASFGYLAAGGIVNFVAGRYFNYQAIEAIGAARAAPFQALTLPYSVLIAFVFLDEGLSIGVGIGVALIMIGPALMVEGRARRPVAVATTMTATEALPDMRSQFELRQVEGYVAAVLASVAYGTSPILFRAALEGETGFSVLAGLVSYGAASIVLLLSIFLPGRRDLLKTLQPATVRVFFGASFFVFLAQMLRFLALSLAPVAVVTGLERTNSVFTLVLSWHLNRTLEFITLRVVIGVLTSVAGALILVAALGA